MLTMVTAQLTIFSQRLTRAFGVNLSYPCINRVEMACLLDTGGGIARPIGLCSPFCSVILPHLVRQQAKMAGRSRIPPACG